MKHFKPNKAQMKIIRKHWKDLDELSLVYYKSVSNIEKVMKQETGIKDIEFIHGSDGGYHGVGNVGRTMKLIQFK